MDFRLSYCTLFLFFIHLATACDRCIHQTKVSFASKLSTLQSGACGYGSEAQGLNNGYLAAAVPGIYKQGAACGACFQIRCKNAPNLCSKAGVTVVVTHLNQNNKTDFVVSSSAFAAMAEKGKAPQLIKLGIVDVEYKRVPCNYKTKNLAMRVEESSKKPNYLAIKFLYQGGQTEIVGVDVSKVGPVNWNFMSRNSGAIWDSSVVLKGALQFRFVVTSGYDGKWYWAKNVLPADWKNGVIYDTGLQITDIAQEGCFPCDGTTWK